MLEVKKLQSRNPNANVQSSQQIFSEFGSKT